jgi:hypothetical protein
VKHGKTTYADVEPGNKSLGEVKKRLCEDSQDKAATMKQKSKKQKQHDTKGSEPDVPKKVQDVEMSEEEGGEGESLREDNPTEEGASKNGVLQKAGDEVKESLGEDSQDKDSQSQRSKSSKPPETAV